MMLLNPEKSKSVIITTRQKHQRTVPPLNLLRQSKAIEQIKNIAGFVSLLMISLGGKPISTITNTVATTICSVSRLRHFTNVDACRTIFHAHIMSLLYYVSNAWDSYSDVHTKKLISVHT